MKAIYTFIVILFPVFIFAQQSPLITKMGVKRISEDHFLLSAKLTLAPGWYIYAGKDPEAGLDPLHFNWNNENIHPVDSLVIESAPKEINDKIFHKKLNVYTGSFTISEAVKVEGAVPPSIKVSITGFASSESEFLPIDISKEIMLDESKTEKNPIIIKSIDLKNPVSACGDKQELDKGLLTIFLIGFIGGLLALLTPCIFPMIPVTVSYFTARAKTRSHGVSNSLLYGSSIFIIYVFASIPFHLAGNIDPQVFNIISTNAWVNVFFFVIFILFALSFFGLFDIKLPPAISNSAGARSGIFFLALTLVIVSFSCTGIILGSLLVNAISKDGNAWQLTAGMGGFGAALGLPFGLFAMFPQWLKHLPKSGGWLDTVKKSLAFVELALAIKFLSNADLVEHWGILKREVFIGLWLLIALLLGLYLFGVFNKKQYVVDVSVKDHLQKRKPVISVGRSALGGIVLLFAVYLFLGVTNSKYANLRLLSGFAPPLSYSIYGKANVHGKGFEPDVVNDYDKALRLAREQNKPLLIDFTGWACVNCRKMEEQVWTKPEIFQTIKDNFILVSLYVDDREKLSPGQRFIYTNKEGQKKEIGTTGGKYAALQSENFGQVTQPLYVILSPDEKLLNLPKAYTSDVKEYHEWLLCGVNAFNK